MSHGVDFSKEFHEEMQRFIANALEEELRIARGFGVPNSIPGMDASRWDTGQVPGSVWEDKYNPVYWAEAKLEGKIELLARAAAIERQNPGMLRALLTKQEAAGLRAMLEVR